MCLCHRRGTIYLYKFCFMRKIFTLVILFLFFCALSLKAQLSSYTFSQSSGSYVEISGTNVATTSWDDETSSVINIGFTFNYNGNNYTQFSINNNGYIGLGGSALVLTYVPISSSTGSNNVISVFGRDLQAQSGSSLQYLVSGSAPNRVLTVQWKGYRRWNATGNNYNFQIKLFETSNIVQFVYGTCTANSTSTSITTGQVGIRGSSSSDFRNRAITSSGTWAASTEGTSNSSTALINNSIFPTSGLTFNWSPPPPCVSPTAQPTSLLFSSVTAGSLNGSFTAATGSPTGYLVVRTLSSTPPSSPANGTIYTPGENALGGTIVYAGAATTFTSTGLNGNTQYYCWVFSYNAGCSGVAPNYRSLNPLSNNVTTPSCTISGNKIIGGVGADYASISAAVSDLTLNGLSGSVTLLLSGTYTSTAEPSFPINIPHISCSNSTTTLTIKPAPGVTTSISSVAATAPILRITGSNIIIDGSNNGSNSRDLTISTSSTTSPFVVLLGSVGRNAISNVTLRNTRLINGSNTTSSYSILILDNSGAAG